jgi:Leucine-rich repeat (LRR) protein
MAFAEDPMGSKLGPPGDDVGPKPSSVHPIAQPARRDTAIHRRLRFTAGIVLTVILAAALVILLQQTKHGTIVVEIDDPSIQVTVDGENIKITQATSGKEFTVKAGPQRLHVQRGDVAFHTDQFSLHRGKKVVLSAKLVQDQLQVVRLADTPTVIGSQPLKRLHESTDTPDGDSGPNRRAVAWAIDVGGSVYATDTLGAKKQVTKLEQLPVRSYKLEMVFGDGDRVTDFGVGQLAGAPAIVHLDLNGTSITDRSMQHIATLSNLEALVLNHTKVSSIGVQSLVGLPKLTSLGLNGVPLDDADLASISQLTQLRRLSVGRYDASLTDAGMAHLRKLTNLEFLFVSSGRATDASLANLAACTQLRHLELYLTRLTDAGLAHLERLQNLEKLVLRYANITDAGFKHFRDMGKLQELAFVNCKSITGSGMAELGELPKLVSLNFIATSVDDTGLEQFGRFPHVAAVILVRTKVTDTGLLRLCKRLHRISTLNLMENPQLTDGAVEPILELGGLKYLYLQNTGITARGVARIQAARPGCQIFSDYPPEEIERLVAEIRLRDS